MNPMSHSLVVSCNPFDMVEENNVVFSFLVRSDASFGSIGFVFPSLESMSIGDFTFLFPRTGLRETIQEYP